MIYNLKPQKVKKKIWWVFGVRDFSCQPCFVPLPTIWIRVAPDTELAGYPAKRIYLMIFSFFNFMFCFNKKFEDRSSRNS